LAKTKKFQLLRANKLLVTCNTLFQQWTCFLFQGWFRSNFEIESYLSWLHFNDVTIFWRKKIENKNIRLGIVLKIKALEQESILPNFFLRKTKIFSVFSLLSWSVCRMRKYCLYFEMAKLKSKNQKNEEIKVW
jgi:hypothetical protein